MLSADQRRAQVISDTARWVERAVIGMGLCPFAGAVQRQGRVHYAISGAQDPRALLEDLAVELDDLRAVSPRERETTLVVIPDAMSEFVEFVLFLPAAEKLLRDRRLQDDFQIASFHPHYVFADLQAHDPANCSNRSPHPTLQLLRQASVAAVMHDASDAEAIYAANIHRLRLLGMEGWNALDVGSTQ